MEYRKKWFLYGIIIYVLTKAIFWNLFCYLIFFKTYFIVTIPNHFNFVKRVFKVIKLTYIHKEKLEECCYYSVACVLTGYFTIILNYTLNSLLNMVIPLPFCDYSFYSWPHSIKWFCWVASYTHSFYKNKKIREGKKRKASGGKNQHF